MNKVESYNVNIYVGLKETFAENREHSVSDVLKICNQFVLNGDCVSVTETNFRYTGGFEKGVIVGFINYPRFPRTEKDILTRALKLAEKLMISLNQYRVTITTPNESIMLSNDKIARA